MGYGALLQTLGAAAAKPAPPNAAMGVGLGAPPHLPGLPPPPTGVGAMPVGDPANDSKQAASDAVMSLRELKGHMPQLGGAIDGLIQQIVAVGKPGGAAAQPSANAGVGPADASAAAAPPPPAPAPDLGGA